MNIQTYKPVYVVDVLLYDNKYYTLQNTDLERFKEILNKDKFITLKGDLVAVSSIKRVEKRLLTQKENTGEYYSNLAKVETVIPKDMITRAKEHAQSLKS